MENLHIICPLTCHQLRWNQHYNYEMSSRYSQDWSKTNKKVMKSFYVAWSDEPDLKLAWSSETAFFNLFPLCPLWRQFFFNKCRFCYFWSNSFTKSCCRMINWKNLFWMSTINASLKKAFISDMLQSFFLVFYRTFITVSFIWDHSFVMFAKNDQFFEPPLHAHAQFYSQKWTIDIFCLKH